MSDHNYETTPTVLEMVKMHLEKNGYDGLYNSDIDCACLKDDLSPCGCISEHCTAGYKHPCDRGDDYEWRISSEKVIERCSYASRK